MPGSPEGKPASAILREQVSLAVKNLPTMQLTSFVVALVLAYSMRRAAPRQNIVVWLFLILAVVGARIVFYLRYVRIRDTAFDGNHWSRAFLALAFASGLAWGSSALLLYPSGRYDLICLILLVMASLSAGTTISHSSLRLGPAAWMAPVLLSYAARCFIEGGSEEYTLGGLILIFFLAVLSHSFTYHRTVTRSIELRFENMNLLDGYRNLFDSIPDAVFILDGEGRILDVNKEAQAVFGRGRDAFLGAALDSLSGIPGTGRARSVTDVVRRAFAGEPQLIEFTGVRSDGKIFPQEVNFTPAAYRGSRVVIAVARDISERKRAEAEMLRTQKLEAIGVLAGGIAHDFNNLLQAVFSFLAVAKRKVADRGKTLLMLEKADRALTMSAKLTTQLLTFSKGGKPVRKRIAVAPVVEAAAGFAMSGSPSTCRFNFQKHLWSVEADDGQIGQVVQNLVLNALEAMPGGGKITVTGRNVDLSRAAAGSVPGPGKWVMIAVRDTGAGIPAEHLQRIFEPYFTTKEKGSGLGLATSYSIIKNHGGMIEVGSAPGTGSTFTVWLPAAGSEAGEEADGPNASVAVSQPGSDQY